MAAASGCLPVSVGVLRCRLRVVGSSCICAREILLARKVALTRSRSDRARASILLVREHDGFGSFGRLNTTMLSENDVKSELSYAWLHAVSAHAGFACSVTHRHLDGAGVDAQVDVRRRLHPESRFTCFSLHFQLKATSQKIAIVGGNCSYSLEVPHYEKLRDTTIYIPRFMVLFELPEAAEEWLNVGPDQLIARKCARWVSLRGAPATENQSSIAVYLPQANVLTPDTLREIATRISLGEDIVYGE